MKTMTGKQILWTWVIFAILWIFIIEATSRADQLVSAKVLTEEAEIQSEPIGEPRKSDGTFYTVESYKSDSVYRKEMIADYYAHHVDEE